MFLHHVHVLFFFWVAECLVGKKELSKSPLGAGCAAAHTVQRTASLSSATLERTWSSSIAGCTTVQIAGRLHVANGRRRRFLRIETLFFTIPDLNDFQAALDAQLRHSLKSERMHSSSCTKLHISALQHIGRHPPFSASKKL